MNFAETWKQWSAVLACVGALTYGSLRFSHAEETIVEHAEQLQKADALHAQQAKLLEALTSAALAEQAAKAERNRICRTLREAGKIKRGDCPAFEP